MAKMGKFSASDLKRFQENLSKIQKQDVDAFVESCAKAIASEVLSRVKPLTPVGDYPNESGRKGGNLRRSWTVREVVKEGNVYKVEVVNLAEDIETHVQYASYVEYGHVQTPGRYVPALGKQLKKAWAPGKFMLTNSEREVQKIAPKLLETKIEKYLRKYME